MAGIFGFFDYTKPGKGVEKDEPQKPRFLFFWELYFRKFWKLVQLNLLFVAFSLLIVTIGPATAGMIYVLRSMANEQPVFLFSDFWDGFKSNLKQSLIYSVIWVVGVILIVTSWRFYSANLSVATWMYVPFGLCVMLAILFIFVSFYAFLMIVTIDLPLTSILKNCAILSIVCIKTNFITLFFVALILLAVYLFLPITALLVILLIPATIGFVICFNCYKEIKKYVIDPYMNKQEPSADDGEDAVIFEDDVTTSGD